MVMKKRIILAVVLLSAAALTVSCNKEKQPVPEETGFETVTLEARFDGPAATRITFTGETELATLTSWESGDCIWVRSDTQPKWERGECFSAGTISQDGCTASFTGRTRKDGKLAAVYPFGSVLDGSNNELVKIDVPQERPLLQNNCPAGSLVAAGILSDGGTALTMKFAVGAVKFSVKGNGEKVSRFELIDGNKDQALWGSLSIQPDYDAKAIPEAAMVNANPSRNRAFLAVPDALTLGATPVSFYFILPEGSLAQGFSLKAYGPDGAVVGRLSSGQDNRIACGKVVRMPEAELMPVSGGTALEGSGMEVDPYLIKDADNLAFLAQVMASETDYPNYSGKYYLQTADIDMTGKDFNPVGTATLPFKGRYDGNGKTIAHLATGGFNSDNPASGLFGYAEGAMFTGLTLNDRSNTGSFGRVGGLVGFAKNCTVSDCHITGGELAATVNFVGGLVGEMEGGSLVGCTASSVKVTNTKNYPGGFIGYAHDGVSIENCKILAGTEVSGANEVGGFVGKMEGGSIKNCSATGAKVSCSSEDAGALGGWVIDSCQIEDCTVSGCEVSAGADYAGGLIGLLQKSTIKNCVVTGETKVTGAKNSVGGFVGYLRSADASTIEDCRVEGATRVNGVNNIGGFVGWFDAGTLKNCVVQGNTTITGSGDGVGGLIGRAVSRNGKDDIIESCEVRGGTAITGTYSLAGLVGYAYPDADGNLYILNSGVIETTIHGLSCDTGGDPTRGDCMDAGIIGWCRLSDAGSKAWVVNCYSYLDALQLDLEMTHPSVGGIIGYCSMSTTGKMEIINCTSSLTPSRLTLNGAPVAPDKAQTGTLYGWLPNRAGIRVSSNHYISDGGLPLGGNGESVVIEGNAGHTEEVFKDGSTVKALLNTFVASCTDYQLKPWSAASGSFPRPE